MHLKKQNLIRKTTQIHSRAYFSKIIYRVISSSMSGVMFALPWGTDVASDIRLTIQKSAVCFKKMMEIQFFKRSYLGNLLTLIMTHEEHNAYSTYVHLVGVKYFVYKV